MPVRKTMAVKKLNLWIKSILIILISLFAYKILQNYTKSNDPFDINSILPSSGQILKSIAIPRVSGSNGNAQVRQFIKSQFPKEFWDIEEDFHVINSAHGPTTSFTNLIITLRKRANRDLHQDQDRVILAAHYDSKLLEAEGLDPKVSISSLKESEFIGASDSAWSCSLMVALGKAIQQEPRPLKYNFQLLFFDGEEAVRNWSESDSLYGSRALASKWSKLSINHFNSLKRINLMILMDLLGTAESNKFYSFNHDNSVPDNHFQELIRIEKELFPEGKIFQESNEFKMYNGYAIEDDHTPFLPFGVPVLHLIPIPFPKVWHKFSDNIDGLDEETCRKLSMIIYKFIKNKLFV